MDPKPDILVLTETWHCESTEFLKIDGYQGFMSSIYLNKSSGVAIFAPNELNVVKQFSTPFVFRSTIS